MAVVAAAAGVVVVVFVYVCVCVFILLKRPSVCKRTSHSLPFRRMRPAPGISET